MILFFWVVALTFPGVASETGGATISNSHYEAGKRLMDRGRFEEALPHLERAVRQNPRHEQAHLQLAALYAEMRRMASAERSLENALKANPGSVTALRELSRIHEERGEYGRALEEFSELLRRRPEDPDRELRLARLHLALSLQSSLDALGENRAGSERLRERLAKMLAIDDRDPLLAYFQGRLMSLEGRPEEAIRDFRRAAGLSSDFKVRAAMELTPLYLDQGRTQPAADQFAVLAESDWEDLAAAREAARLSVQTGDLATAEKYFRRVWSMKPSALLARELGEVLLATGRFEQASDLYRQVAAKDQPELRWSLAQAYKKDGQYSMALREFESLLSQYPDRKALEREIHDVTQLRLEAAAPATEGLAAGADDARDTLTPQPLLGLADGRYALLVDKSTQSLSLYRGEGGETRHVKTYACSTGENDGEKLEKGDKKTPEGIYQFTEIKTSKELPAIYGKLAFPMDYPNFFDRRQGKNGSGIWLHSTDEPIRALLPQKTRGCIVVNDPVIDELAKTIRLFDTPIVVARTVEMGSRETRDAARREIEELLRQWRESWQSKDLERYLGLYSSGFRHEGMDLPAWRRYKEAIFQKSGRIVVRISTRHLLQHEDQAVASFKQDYTADSHSDSGVKRLFLVRENGLWRIAGEEWRPL